MNLFFFRKHRCCAMCAEEYQSESITRPLGPLAANAQARIENTEALESLQRTLQNLNESNRKLTLLIKDFGGEVPTYIQTSSGIRMNLPEGEDN